MNTRRYEMLCEFFNAMASSIRLLRLKRQPATLTKLSRNIESLTDRRFTLHHLAQLKHIVPDVIDAKKTRVQDEQTGCVKEDLLISLDVNAVETDKIAKGTGGFSHLKGYFHSRIVDFATTHPESDDVPEGELPDLFYKPKHEPEPVTNQMSVLQPTALMSPSFQRRFSSRATVRPVSEPSIAKTLPEMPTTVEIDGTPVKVASTPSKYDSTPAKYASTPARLMAATPVLRTPKRSLMMVDGAVGVPNKPAKRNLRFFEENNDNVTELPPSLNCFEEIDVKVRNCAASNDLLDVLPENVVHSLMAKEQRILEEQDPIVSQARKREQLMAGVPKLFDMIQLSFQSIRRSVLYT